MVEVVVEAVTEAVIDVDVVEGVVFGPHIGRRAVGGHLVERVETLGQAVARARRAIWTLLVVGILRIGVLGLVRRAVRVLMADLVDIVDIVEVGGIVIGFDLDGSDGADRRQRLEQAGAGRRRSLDVGIDGLGPRDQRAGSCGGCTVGEHHQCLTQIGGIETGPSVIGEKGVGRRRELGADVGVVEDAVQQCGEWSCHVGSPPGERRAAVT